MTFKDSNLSSASFCPSLTTVICCCMLNFVCLGRNFLPLQPVKAYNMGGFRKLILIWKFLTYKQFLRDEFTEGSLYMEQI
jgi:hypothetical protein